MRYLQESSRVTFWSSLFYLVCGLSSALQPVEADGGATLSLYYSYQNPTSKREDGNKCDWVGDRRCDVFIKFCLRDVYSRSQDVHNCLLLDDSTGTRDNNDKFAAATKVHIAKPVPRTYALRVTIYDSDVFQKVQLIGDFIAERFQLQPNGVRIPIGIRRKSKTFYNPNLKFTIDMNLTCVKNYFGDYCDKFCVPVAESFTCDDQGNRICKPGLRGEYCDLEDSCHFEPCAEYATCTNRPDNMGRICECNGREGPECYPGYDPCQRNPCQNGGTCHLSGPFKASFVCNCTLGWTGHRCADRASACKEAEKSLHINSENEDTTPSSIKTTELMNNSTRPSMVCLNGGTCYDHVTMFTYRCVCLPGWMGDHCEAATSSITSTKIAIYMLWVAIPVCSALIFVIAVLGYRYRRSRRVLMYMNKKGGIVYYHNNSDTLSIHNNSTEYQTHFINRDYTSMRSDPDKTTVESAHLNKHTDQNTSSDVYDECNPLGLDSGANVYGTTFDIDLPLPSLYQATELPPSQEIAPPLPERPNYLALPSSPYNHTAQDVPYSQTTRGSLYSLEYDTGTRRSRVYRPTSPPTFTPGSVLDGKGNNNYF